MSLESIDFQTFVQQHVTQIMPFWEQAGFSHDEIQNTASQFYQMGCIAAQQIQQEGSIQPQGSTQQIPYTPDMAQKIIVYFLRGLHFAILKLHEEAIPHEQMGQFMQNVAYHVFEHSKQVTLATLGQEKTPEVQISEDQINGWLGQTATEAVIYFINEYEKQHGPLQRTNIPVMPSILEENTGIQEDSIAESPHENEEMIQEMPVSPHSLEAPDIHHKYAAIGLFLSTMPATRQAKILETFSPEAMEIIKTYQDPEIVARNLDLKLVSRYLKQFKEKIGGSRSGHKQNQYASTTSQLISKLPLKPLEELFKHERPLVKGYVSQLANNDSNDTVLYTLPSGVEESLLLYLNRNFPGETASL